jgi:signal transduction histidine kinase/CheY-like chemotaxis protein
VPCTLPPIPSDVEATLRSFEERDSDLETKIADRTAALTQALRASLDANEVKNTFIATLSHELRTPLSGIIGISELLLENSAHSTPNNDLKKILGASRHLLDLVNQVLDLVNQVLDLSKIEAGHIHLQREPLELRPLVLEITDLVQPLCDRRRNTLQVTCPEAIGRLDADATKLRQILLNLLSNACQFTKAGHISLTATRCATPSSDLLRIDITDTGIGLTPEQLTRLFQPFSQPHRTGYACDPSGTGLGLCLSRHYARLMGGDITVTSTPHQGSTFTLNLPTQLSCRPIPASPAPSSETPSNGARILLVEDNAMNRDMLARRLTQRGFNLTLATNGAEAIALARSAKPALILMDLSLPLLDGWQATRILKNDPVTAAIPIIALTAHALDEQSPQAFEAGCDDFETKPIALPGLLAKIHALLQATAARP